MKPYSEEQKKQDIEVKNNLRDVPEGSMPDDQIRESVRSIFTRTYPIDEESIGVEVKNGSVHLYGKVPNFLVLIQAHNIVRHTNGVRNVVNDLTVW
jgi:osmotically-inducible protein OsmY